MKRGEFDILIGVLTLILAALIYFLLSPRWPQPIEIVRTEIENIIRNGNLSENLEGDLRNAVHKGDDVVFMTFGFANLRATVFAVLVSLLSGRLIYTGVRLKIETKK